MPRQEKSCRHFARIWKISGSVGPAIVHAEIRAGYHGCVKRAVFKLMVFLLLGAAVNVAVAWGCALRIPSYSWPPRSPTPTEVQWLRSHGEKPAVLFSTAYDFAGFGLQGCDITLLDSTFEGPTSEMARDEASGRIISKFYPAPDCNAFTIRAGYPLRCAAYEHWVHSSDWASANPGKPKIELIGGLQRHRNGRILPIGWDFKAAIVNTLCYAAAIWSALSAGGTAARLALGRTRRSKRIRLGQCVRCGYDLRGVEHPRCPECGTPPKGRAR